MSHVRAPHFANARSLFLQLLLVDRTTVLQNLDLQSPRANQDCGFLSRKWIQHCQETGLQ
jgi:hypothetical protein